MSIDETLQENCSLMPLLLNNNLLLIDALKKNLHP